MKKLLITGLLLLLIFQVKAQRNFQPGYIVQNNDTIMGWINLRTHKANSLSCQFKTNLKGGLQQFKASEISAYGTQAGNHFRSFALKETSQAVPKKKDHPKSYFLNVLVEGKASLFFGRDISSKSRFFIQKDTVFTELETAEIRVQNKADGRVYKGQSKPYLGTLTYLFADCKDLKPLIEKTKFGPVSLTETVRSYNQCIHPDSLYFVQKPKKPITTFGVTAGPVFTNTQLSQDYNPFALPIGSVKNSGYSFGLTMNNTLPFLNEKLSFETGLLLIQNRFEAKNEFSRFDSYLSPNTSIVKYEFTGKITRIALKVPILLRYSFNFQKLRPYIDLGLMVTKVVDTNDQSILIIDTDKFRKSYDYPGYFPRPIHGNLVAGGGLLFTLHKNKAVFLELRLVPEGIRSLYDTSADISSFMINTGFRY